MKYKFINYHDSTMNTINIKNLKYENRNSTIKINLDI
jgi:hypothetical protein